MIELDETKQTQKTCESRYFGVCLLDLWFTSCSMKIFQKRAVVGKTDTSDSYSERTSLTWRFCASRRRTDQASTSYGRSSTVCWARTKRSCPHSYSTTTTKKQNKSETNEKVRTFCEFQYFTWDSVSRFLTISILIWSLIFIFHGFSHLKPHLFWKELS